MKLVEQTIQRAIELGACGKADASISTLEDVVKLLKSPQGREWVVKNSYPDLEHYRKFKPMHPERIGVYIDSGVIHLTDEKSVVLIGDTDAKIEYNGVEKYNLLVLCGATANVVCNDFSVLKIETDDHSYVSSETHDHAVIFK